MNPREIDIAIDALALDEHAPSNDGIEAIVNFGVDYFDACNDLSLRVARRFLDDDLDFGGADAVMNWVWSQMLRRLERTTAALAEPAMAIYEAFDAGEFQHKQDSVNADPVEKYTVPRLKAILATEESTGPGQLDN